MDIKMRKSAPMQTSDQTGQQIVAIVGATVLDGNGGQPVEDGVVLIEGARILEVGDRSVQIPSRARQVEARGKWVIPGLMDAYVYLVDGVTPSTMIRYEGRYDEIAIESAQLTLLNGVTTVFDAWGPRDYLIKARDAVNRGSAIASRIFLCGNCVGSGGPYDNTMRPQFRDAVGGTFADRINSIWQADVGLELTSMSSARIRERIRRYVQTGIDYLSYTVNLHRPGSTQYMVFSPSVQQAIVEEAHHAGLVVSAWHSTTEEGVRSAVDSGADLVTGPILSVEFASLLAQRRVACNISCASPISLEWFRRNRNLEVLDWFEGRNRFLRELASVGATILLGTEGSSYDADHWNDWRGICPVDEEKALQLGESHFASLKAVEHQGLEPMAILLSMTRNVAKSFKVDKNLGTLEHGKLADLVILDADPLQSAENYRRISLVMKEGIVVNRDSLPAPRHLAG
jgi:imidazolonepropionase-like amidohydrolase